MLFLTNSNIGIISLGIVGVGGVYATKFLLQNEELSNNQPYIQNSINTEKTVLEYLHFSDGGRNKECQILLENTSEMINKCSFWMEKMNQHGRVTDILSGSEEEVLKKLKDLVVNINSPEKIEEKRIWKGDKITCSEQDKFEGDTRIICIENTIP